MTISLELHPDLQRQPESAALSAGISPDELAGKIIEQGLQRQSSPRGAVALLRAWRDPALAAEQKQTGEILTRTLDEDRTSARKLFPPELQGQTW
jgi:hypothetical protein